MTVTSKTLAHAGDYMSNTTGVILQYSDVDKPQDSWLVSDKIPLYDEWIGRCMSAPERRWLKMEQIVIENLPIRSKDSSYGVGLGEKPPSTTRAREQGGKNARRTQAPELSEGAKRFNTNTRGVFGQAQKPEHNYRRPRFNACRLRRRGRRFRGAGAICPRQPVMI